MNTIASRRKITVSADGRGIVSQAGGLLLMQTLRVTGLDKACQRRLARWRPGRAVHDPGKILADLALALALGGDCLADVAVLRSQPELFGPVASDPTVSRLIDALAADAARGAEGDPRRPRRRPRAGLGAGRRSAPPAPTASRDRGHRRHHRDRPLREAARGPDLEEDLRPPPADRLRRPRPGAAPESRWPSCCGPATPAPTPPPTTSRPPGSPWPSCPKHRRRNVLIRTDSGGGTHEFLAWLTRPGRWL